jgi:hypothetical protein
MQGGRREGAGRPKGALNVHTRKIKEAVLNAFEEVGGEKWLVKLAQEDPKTFCALLAKLIPAEVKASVSTSDAFEQTLIAGRQRVVSHEKKLTVI